MESAMLGFYKMLLDGYLGGTGGDKLKRRVLYGFLDMLGDRWIRERLRLNRSVLDDVAEGLLRNDYMVVDVEAKLTYRLITGVSGGLGSEVFEVGVAWHPVLDTPFIPGSGVKGALRSYLEANNVLDDACIDILMGSRSVRGALLVADSYPVEPGRDGLVLIHDVLTPHYYRGGEPVKQELYIDNIDEYGANPVPIPHFAVAEETVFRFIIGVPPERDVLGCLAGEGQSSFTASAAYRVVALVQRTLSVIGVGARTTKGYGRFKVLKARYSVPSQSAGEGGDA